MDTAAWSKWITDPSIVFGVGKHLRYIPEQLYRFERVIVKKQHHRMITTQVAMIHALIVQVGSVKACPSNDETFSSVVRQYDVQQDDSLLGGYGTAYGQRIDRYRKPHALLVEHMSQWSPPWDVVLDPFIGSGSTLFAAETLGRACYGVELNPRNCDAIIDAWQRMTGQQAHKVAS
jgi:hypothetical protein